MPVITSELDPQRVARLLIDPTDPAGRVRGGVHQLQSGPGSRRRQFSERSENRMRRNAIAASRPARLWAVVIDNSLLLLAGAVSGLVWANVDLDLVYAFLARVAVRRQRHRDGLLLCAGGEGDRGSDAAGRSARIAEGGGRADPRRPRGASSGPPACYILQAVVFDRPELVTGWAIPCATDIAFSYLVARLIFPRNHPAIPFLLLLAIADDAIGLVLLALFFPAAHVSMLWFAALMIPALAASAWLRRRRTTSFWPYLTIGGGLSWAALFFGGIHPALAMVPVLPFMPHAQRDLGLFDQRERDLPDTMNRFEHAWKIPVQFVLLLFGLVNAGVALSSLGDGHLMVFLALLLGKPLGYRARDIPVRIDWPADSPGDSATATLRSWLSPPASALPCRSFSRPPRSRRARCSMKPRWERC